MWCVTEQFYHVYSQALVFHLGGSNSSVVLPTLHSKTPDDRPVRGTTPCFLPHIHTYPEILFQIKESKRLPASSIRESIYVSVSWKNLEFL